MIGIYLIRNKINDKFYIGSSTNIKIRLIGHRHHLKKGDHINKHLQNSYNKYGKEAFEYYIITECLIDELLNFEQWFIDILKPEFNITLHAEAPTRGIKHTKEHRDKINITRELNGVNKVTSERMKKNKYSLGTKRTKKQIEILLQLRYNKVRRSINQLDINGNFIQNFYSIKDAAKFVNVSVQALHKSCNNYDSTCKGFKWQYANNISKL